MTFRFIGAFASPTKTTPVVRLLGAVSILLLAACSGGSEDRPQAPDPNEVEREGEGVLIPVPGDPARAVYQLVEMSQMSNGNLKVLTRRDGSSGTSYARREINCRNMTFRYVGEGDTRVEAEEDSPNRGSMGELVAGSISTEISEFACARAN
jgi:hypothetical protein